MLAARIFIALAAVTGVAKAAPHGTFTADPQIFSGRQKHAIDCTGLLEDHSAEVYLQGGRLGDGYTNTDDLWRYNVTANRWSAVNAVVKLTPGREAHSLSILTSPSKRLVVFGGRVDNTQQILGDVWVFLVETSRWSLVTPTLGFATPANPAKRYRHATVVTGASTFLVFFGLGLDRYRNDVYEYDASVGTTGRWRLLHGGTSITSSGVWRPSPLPSGRFDSCCVYSFTNRTTYCFGGTTESGDTNEVWAFFSTNSTWRLLEVTGTAPSARRLAMCALLPTPTGRAEGALVIWSGFVAATSENVNGNVTHWLNVDTLMWTMVNNSASQPQPAKRDGGRLCTIQPEHPFGETNALLVGGLRTITLPSGVETTVVGNDVWELHRGTFRFSVVSASRALPPGRARHAMVVRGMSLFVFFGQGSSGLLSDVWEYNITAATWSEAVATTPANITAVVDSVAVLRGTQAWIVFGVEGLQEPKKLSNSITTFNTVSKSWGKLFSAMAPPARAGHGAAFFNDFLYVLGGYGDGDLIFNDLWVYNPASYLWYTAISPEQFAGRQYGTLVRTEVDGGGLFLIGGLTALGSTAEVWSIRNLRLPASLDETIANVTWTLHAKSTTQAPLLSVTPSTFVVGRGAHASAGEGHMQLVCGGEVFMSGATVANIDGFPVNEVDTCYIYNMLENVVTGVDPMPFPSSGGTAAYFGNTAYFFGGNLQQNGVLRGDVFLNTVQKFSLTSGMCTQGLLPSNFSHSNCFHCSYGTYLSTATSSCVPASKGAYVSTLTTTTQQLCEPGFFNPLEGGQGPAFCAPCEFGTYNPARGASACLGCGSVFCPVGSTSLPQANHSSNSSNASSLQRSVGGLSISASVLAEARHYFVNATQPSRFKPEELPSTFIIALPTVCVGMFLVFLVMMGLWVIFDDLRVQYYLGEYEPAVADMYYKHLESFDGSDTRGLSAGRLWLAATAAIDILPLSGRVTAFRMPAETLYLANKGLLDKLDAFGTKHLSAYEFVDAMCQIFEDQNLPFKKVTRSDFPLEESDDDCVEMIAEAQLKRDKIRQKGHEPLLVSGSTCERVFQEKGNVFIPYSEYCSSISKWFISLNFRKFDSWGTAHDTADMGEAPILIATTAGGLIWFPFMIAVIALTATLTVQYVTDNTVESVTSLSDVLVDPNVQSDIVVEVISSGPSKKEACVQQNATTGAWVPFSMCHPNTVIGDDDGTLDGFRGNFSTWCKYDDQTCSLKFECGECTMDRATAAIPFLFGTDWFSSLTHVSVTATTGIRDSVVADSEESNLVLWTEPELQTETFKGFPATTLSVQLTPTRFYMELRSGAVRDYSGYHVAQGPGSSAAGNVAPLPALPALYGVPVMVGFELAPTAVVVNRQNKKSPADFVSAILGVMPGLTAPAVAIVAAVDGFFLWKRKRELNNRRKAWHKAGLAEGGEEKAPTLAQDIGCCGAVDKTEAKRISQGVHESNEFHEVQVHTMRFWTRLVRAGLHRTPAKAIVVAAIDLMFVMLNNNEKSTPSSSATGAIAAVKAAMEGSTEKSPGTSFVENVGSLAGVDLDEVSLDEKKLITVAYAKKQQRDMEKNVDIVSKMIQEGKVNSESDLPLFIAAQKRREVMEKARARAHGVVAALQSQSLAVAEDKPKLVMAARNLLKSHHDEDDGPAPGTADAAES